MLSSFSSSSFLDCSTIASFYPTIIIRDNLFSLFFCFSLLIPKSLKSLSISYSSPFPFHHCEDRHCEENDKKKEKKTFSVSSPSPSSQFRIISKVPSERRS